MPARTAPEPSEADDLFGRHQSMLGYLAGRDGERASSPLGPPSLPPHFIADTPARMVNPYSQYAAVDRAYPSPSASLPSHSQYAYPLPPRNGHVLVPSHTPLQMHSTAHPPWHPHVRVQVMPPPPPMVHKVWILDCKSCGMFLTNRGMKAVLLLRPNVPLYSTDALPINCSAYSPDPGPSSPASPSSSPSSSQQPNTSTRTCECLTQTLCCHGCGSAVGYMIVSPCRRCTSSISASNRTTNGHRFVFYSAEVVAGERLYVLGERGVHAFHPPQPLRLVPINSSGLHAVSSRAREPPAMSPLSSPRSDTDDDNSMPELVPLEQPVSPGAPPPSRRMSAYPSARTTPDANALSAGSAGVWHTPAGLAVETIVPPEPERLKAGEVLYWHHLVRSGEIPPVAEDVRARGPRPDDETHAGKDAADTQRRAPVGLKHTVFAGR